MLAAEERLKYRVGVAAQIVLWVGVPILIITHLMIDVENRLYTMIGFLILNIFVTSTIFLKCGNCGTRLFMDPDMRSTILPNVNLIKPLNRNCPCCGYYRGPAEDNDS
jgi:hypothetical protein